MFIEDDLGIVVNTPCTAIWEGVDRGLNPLAFTHSRLPINDYSIEFFHHGLREKVKVEIPSNLFLWTLPQGERSQELGKHTSLSIC